MTDLDKHTHLLGVGNGAVDLRSGKLLPATMDHYITIVTAVNFDADATCPLFEQTVADVFFGDGDGGVLPAADRLRDPGQSARGHPDHSIRRWQQRQEHRAGRDPGCAGRARQNGQRGYLSEQRAGRFTGQRPREDVLRLRGARFVYSSEPDEGSESCAKA